MKTFTTMATVAVVMTITGCATAPQNSAAVSGVGMSSAEAAAGQISSTASVAGQLPTAGTVGAGMMGNVAGSAPVAAQAPA